MGLHEWVLVVTGFALALCAIYLVHRELNVTAGHALIFGVAAAIFCLPFVSSFEWTKDGFKIATRQLAADLTAQVAAVGSEQKNQAAELVTLTKTLADMNNQVNTLLTAMKDLQSGKVSALPSNLDEQGFSTLEKAFERSAERSAVSLTKTLAIGQKIDTWNSFGSWSKGQPIITDWGKVPNDKAMRFEQSTE